MATDLRASASLVIAGLVADGETHDRPHLPPRPRLRPDGSQAARGRRRHRDAVTHEDRCRASRRTRHRAVITLALSKGRIFEETLPLLRGGRHRRSPRTRSTVAQADPRRPAAPTCAWCWCAPPTCRPTCSTAAPTSAWSGKDVLLEHGGQGLYQPLDLRIARCRMSVAARDDFDYAARGAAGLADPRGDQVHAHRAPSTSPTRACTST